MIEVRLIRDCYEMMSYFLCKVERKWVVVGDEGGGGGGEQPSEMIVINLKIEKLA